MVNARCVMIQAAIVLAIVCGCSSSPALHPEDVLYVGDSRRAELTYFYIGSEGTLCFHNDMKTPPLALHRVRRREYVVCGGCSVDVIGGETQAWVSDTGLLEQGSTKLPLVKGRSFAYGGRVYFVPDKVLPKRMPEGSRALVTQYFQTHGARALADD